MQCRKDNNARIWRLIKERMDEGGINEIDIAEQDVYLARLIKKGTAGYPATIQDDELYRCAQLLGLISHRYASGRIPSREELITLFEFGESSYPRQNRLVDWGC